jgi:hypothetical protein
MLKGNKYSNTPNTEYKLYKWLRVEYLIKIHHQSSDMQQIQWQLDVKYVCKLKKAMSSSIFKCDEQKSNISSNTLNQILWTPTDS